MRRLLPIFLVVSGCYEVVPHDSVHLQVDVLHVPAGASGLSLEIQPDHGDPILKRPVVKADGSATAAFPEVPDGELTITATAESKAVRVVRGHAGPDRQVVIVDFAVGPAVTRLEVKTPDGKPLADGDLTNADQAIFTFESMPGATFECQTSEAFAPCTSPTTVALAEGENVFRVHAIDGAGIAGQDVQVVLEADHTAPTTTLHAKVDGTDVASGIDLNRTFSLEFSLSATDAVTRCSLDHGDFVACTSPYASPAVDEGAHTIVVRAQDVAGNVEANPPEFTWFQDVTAPGAVVDSVVANGRAVPALGATNAVTAKVTAHASALRDGERASLEYAFDAATWRPLAEAVELPVTEGLATLSVRATDAAGNVGAPTSLKFLVDRTAPATVVTAATSAGAPLGPGAATASKDVTVTFRSEDEATFLCAVDLAAAEPCTSPWTATVTGDGPHGVRVQAQDLAGNLEARGASFAWVLDTVPPTTTLTAQAAQKTLENHGLTNRRNVDFSFSAAGDATFTCTADGVAGPCTSPFGMPVTDGPHTFAVFATDAAGNVESPGPTFDFVVDSNPPVILDTSATIGNRMISLGFRALDGGLQVAAAGLAELRVRTTDGFDSGPLAPSLTHYDVTGLVNCVETTALVYARDNAGNENTIEMKATPRPPKLSPTVHATPDSLQFSWTVLPPSANVSAYRVGTSTTSGGPYGPIHDVTGGSYVSAAVAPGTYYAKILALDGTCPGLADQITYVVPAPPDGLVATGGVARVKLTWNAAGMSKWVVYRGPRGGPYASLGTADHPFFDDLAPANGPNTYVVTALGPDGESRYSVEVTASPLPDVTGVVDDGFGALGATILPDSSEFDTLGFDSQGRILAGGARGQATAAPAALCRFDANGHVDATWTSTGCVLTGTAGADDNAARSLVVDASDRPVSAGSIGGPVAFWRHRTDSVLDPTFAVSGSGVLHPPQNPAWGTAIAAIPGGGYWGGGWSATGPASTVARVWKLTAAGEFDTSFNGSGLGSLTAGGDDQWVSNVVLDASGRVLVGGHLHLPGQAGYKVVVWRLLADGTVDNGFGSSGHVILASGASPVDGVGLAPAANGRVYVATSDFTGGSAHVLVYGLLGDGSLDPNFATNGVLTSTQVGSAQDLHIDPRGRLLVCGRTSGRRQMAFWRWGTNGAPDTTFAGTGYLAVPALAAGSDDMLTDCEFDLAGRIVATGTVVDATNTTRAAIVRIR